MPRRHHARSAGCEIDMTPMIDVVFQLIIFFIVTMTMEKRINENIKLELAEHAEIIEKLEDRTVVVEVNQHGWISIRATQLKKSTFKNFMINRYNRYGSFPVLIRGDYRTKHQDIRWVMDVCAGVGIWRINFAAIQEKKTE